VQRPKTPPVPTPVVAKSRPHPIAASTPDSAECEAARPASRGSMGGISFGGGGGGCISGSCTILKADGSLCLVSEVVAGDRLACSANGKSSAVVLCVLVTHILSGKTRMATFSSGLCVTPGHPVLLDGIWVRPKDVTTPRLVDCEFYYNFLFQPGTGTALVVNGTLCVALGHGTKGDVREHAFWGSWEALAAAMRSLDKEGFERGRVTIEEMQDNPNRRYSDIHNPEAAHVHLEETRKVSAVA
jgi:hypothetical protein